MMLVYEAILDGYNTQQGAIDYARGMVWSECEATEQNIKYKDYIDTINGVGVVTGTTNNKGETYGPGIKYIVIAW